MLALSLALGGCPKRAPLLSETPFGLSLLTAEGAPYDLAVLKGKVALLTFFATWCMPCMIEVPIFQSLQREHGKEGFQVIAIGMDLEGQKVLLPFARSLKEPYTVLIADEAMRQGRSPYGMVQQLPTSFLLDRDGKVALAWTGLLDPATLEKQVAKLTR